MWPQRVVRQPSVIQVVLLSACRTHVTVCARKMTESAGVQVVKRPVSVNGGMTERLEIQQNLPVLLDFA